MICIYTLFLNNNNKVLTNDEGKVIVKRRKKIFKQCNDIENIIKELENSYNILV